MAGKPQVTLTFAGDATKLQKASEQAAAAVRSTSDQVAAGGKQYTKAGQETSGYADKVARTGVAVLAVSGAFDAAGSALQTFGSLSQRGERHAIELARAQGEVEQASIDAEQAVVDLRQATEDLSQAQLDGKQASRDVAQAALDVEQASIDAEQAQKDYNTAVKEHGKGSIEARQASLDLKQAQEDLAQANLDSEQASADARQAGIDHSQALVDQKQAARDATDAQLNLRDAQLNTQNPDLNQWIQGLTDAGSAIALLTLATNALSLSTIKETAAMVASKVATVATSVATGIYTAAQWLLNIALTANPIGIIIVAIGALIAAIIYIATQTTIFQDTWNWIWSKIGDPVKAAWAWIVKTATNAWNWLKALPGKIGDAFKSVADFISRPFRAAFNLVATAWNNTIGKLSWDIPSWVPGIGGRTISAPKLPKFHDGGVVPGAPGREMLAVLQAGETVIPAGRSGSTTLEIRSDGTRVGDLLVEILRDSVRVRGGNVQLALGINRG